MFHKAAVCLAVCLAAAVGAEPQRVRPYTLVRFKADGVDPKAGIIWRVHPPAGVQRATTAKHILEFTAPPGTYTVTRLVIKTGADGAVDIEEWEAQVEIERDGAVQPPVPKPLPPREPPKDAPKEPRADPHGALGRIQFGSSGCTATVVWPRRPDGRWDVLTAEHCVSRIPVGGKGQMQLRGRPERFGVTLAAKDARPDVAWLITDAADLGDLPHAVLAERNAERGVKVWHAGFGVDAPGNREDGEVTRADSGTGKAEMVLSVSSGDSGGGIFRHDTGELISTVCCTTQKGARVTMFGGNVESIRRLRPDGRTGEDVSDWWKPLPIPITRDAVAADDWWTPIAVPECGTATLTVNPGAKR